MLPYFIKFKSPILPFILLVAISACRQNSEISGVESSSVKVDSTYYQEEHRPQFHFSPGGNWMNDPNGMVYLDGEYHLFYQYYPDSTVWGPMHWGHAVSENLTTWEHLPIALAPDELGYIFSGSAVVDHNNTSGFGSKDNPPLIAIFTHHDMAGEQAKTNTYQYQSIAYSLDKGRTFTKYEGNPVVKNPGIKDFRDPKVIWDEANSQWVMVFAAYDKVLFYVSSDLKSWEKTGEFGIEGDERLWECPDLFPMSVNGTEKQKWVLIVSIQKEGPNGGTASAYFVGDWDGKTFQGDPDQLKWLDYGTDNYAMVTWSDVPKSDGRRIGLGWMSNWQYAQVVPTEKWRSAMTIPRTLELEEMGADNFLVRSSPVSELSSLDGETTSLTTGIIEEDKVISAGKELLKVELLFKRPETGLIQLRFSNDLDEYIDFGFQADANEYFIDRTFAGKSDFSDVFGDYHTGAATKPTNDSIKLLAYLDVASIELFAEDGACVMTDIFFPNANFDKLEILTEYNDVELLEGKVTELKSIWR